jgi:hypothetical protein
MSGPKKYTLIQTVGDAAEVLVTQWPSDDGEEYFGAVVACLDALHQTASPHTVREALIRAANEVHIPHLSLVEGCAA